MLLASHATPGAQAAETLAFKLCTPGTVLWHLWIVPKLWQGMMGDDWLNNVRTRIAFGNYVEQQLTREAAEHIKRLAQIAADQALDYRPQMRLGEPTAALIEYARTLPCELVIIGAPRPHNQAGLRSRIQLDKLTRALRQPLLIAPQPKI